MFSLLFIISILALSVVVSATALPAVDETADATVKRACQPACCDLLVQSHDSTLDGVTCDRGGIDCPFSGQLTACCESFTLSKNAHKCTLH